MGVGIDTILDICAGILTLMYTIYMLKRKNKGIVFKLMTLILLVPMILYLLNVPLEYTSNKLFDFSINKSFVDALYKYTLWGTVDNFITKVQINLAEKFTLATDINYQTLLPSIWVFATDSLNHLGAKIISDIGTINYPQ